MRLGSIFRLIALLVILGGCAVATHGGAAPTSPRARCLSELGGGSAEDRPLFFLFCIEAP